MENDKKTRSFTFMSYLEDMKTLQKIAAKNERTIAAELRVAIADHIWRNREQIQETRVGK